MVHCDVLEKFPIYTEVPIKTYGGGQTKNWWFKATKSVARKNTWLMNIFQVFSLKLFASENDNAVMTFKLLILIYSHRNMSTSDMSCIVGYTGT